MVGVYRDPIELMDGPSNMKNGLCWYQKGTNNKLNYDLINHLVVDFKIIFALASMIYNANLNAYTLHQGKRNFSTNLLRMLWYFHYTYDRG